MLNLIKETNGNGHLPRIFYGDCVAKNLFRLHGKKGSGNPPKVISMVYEKIYKNIPPTVLFEEKNFDVTNEVVQTEEFGEREIKFLLKNGSEYIILIPKVKIDLESFKKFGPDWKDIAELFIMEQGLSQKYPDAIIRGGILGISAITFEEFFQEISFQEKESVFEKLRKNKNLISMGISTRTVDGRECVWCEYNAFCPHVDPTMNNLIEKIDLKKETEISLLLEERKRIQKNLSALGKEYNEKNVLKIKGPNKTFKVEPIYTVKGGVDEKTIQKLLEEGVIMREYILREDNQDLTELGNGE